MPATAGQLRDWLDDLAEATRAGQVSTDQLVALLAGLRAASTAYGHAEDWVLLAHRDLGGSLRHIAPAMGRGYVRSPAARLEKLGRQYATAEELLTALHNRHAETEPGQGGQHATPQELQEPREGVNDRAAGAE
jgi:hypothetical protein